MVRECSLESMMTSSPSSIISSSSSSSNSTLDAVEATCMEEAMLPSTLTPSSSTFSSSSSSSPSATLDSFSTLLEAKLNARLSLLESSTISTSVFCSSADSFSDRLGSDSSGWAMVPILLLRFYELWKRSMEWKACLDIKTMGLSYLAWQFIVYIRIWFSGSRHGRNWSVILNRKRAVSFVWSID